LAERGNVIILVACMNTTSTYIPPLIVSKKKYERGAYGWSTGGLNFGLPSQVLDSDWYYLLNTAIPVQAYYRPRGFKEVEAHRFRDNCHMKVVRLSALCTGCLITQEIFLVRISVRGQVDPRATVRPKNRVNEKFQWNHWKSNPRPSIVQCLNQLHHRMAACIVPWVDIQLQFGPQTQQECILVSMLLYQQVTGCDHGSQKLMHEPSQSEPSIFILISKNKM